MNFTSSLSNTEKTLGNKKPKKKNIAPTIMLTSLVDTFSVLVIYLLFNFSTETDFLKIKKGFELPAAAHATKLEMSLVVKVEDGVIYIDDEKVKSKNLVSRLLKAQKYKSQEGEELTEIYSKSLIIQADKKQEFELLSRIIQAGGQVGFSDINFAVVQK